MAVEMLPQHRLAARRHPSQHRLTALPCWRCCSGSSTTTAASPLVAAPLLPSPSPPTLQHLAIMLLRTSLQHLRLTRMLLAARCTVASSPQLCFEHASQHGDVPASLQLRLAARTGASRYLAQRGGAIYNTGGASPVSVGLHHLVMARSAEQHMSREKRG